MDIQADHVLRAYEQAARRRLAQTITVRHSPGEKLEKRLAADDAELPEAARYLDSRYPDEPFRRRFGSIAERLRRTRERQPAGTYASPNELADEFDEIAADLAAAGLDRVIDGELLDLQRQLETFGFHGLSLEIRQHSDVHAAALRGEAETATEVAESFRAMADIQATYGSDACCRYVISFTRSAADVLAVLELARPLGSAPASARRGAALRIRRRARECGAIIDQLLPTIAIARTSTGAAIARR